MSLFLPQNPNIATFAATTSSSLGTGSVATGITANTVQSIFYLWHPSTNPKRIEISYVGFTSSGGAGGNYFSINGAFITAENGTPGGTLETPVSMDRSDPGSSLTGSSGAVRTGATGAPTRATFNSLVDVISSTQAGQQYTLFDVNKTGKPLVLRSGSAEGFEFRTIITGSLMTTAAQVSMTVFWTES